MRLSRHFKSDVHFATACTAIFSVVIAVGLWRHEMWRDEYHAWGLVLHSHSLSQMLSNLRGEGHLPFSYLIFYFISRFTANPHAVQFAQFFTAMASAYLLLRYAPFKRWQKVLFLFGYFPLYEYGVISRSYTWDMLGLFGFCAVYGWAKEKGRSPWLSWIFLLILVTNESFGILMALPLIGLLLTDLRDRHVITQRTWLWIGSVCISSATIFTYALLRIVPLSQWNGLLYRTPDNFSDGFKLALQVLKRIVLPRIHLPNHIGDFSVLEHKLLIAPGNVNWLTIIFLLAAIYIIVRLLLASARLPFNFCNRPPVFAIWVSGFSLLFLLFWFSGGAIYHARHTGHFLLFFIACWWLAAYFPEKHPAAPSRWLLHVQKYAKSDFRFLLLTQLALGLFTYSLDIIYPFSANQATASHLQNQSLQHAALIAPEAVTLAAGRSAYNPQYDIVTNTLLLRDTKRATYLSNPTKPQLAQRMWRYINANNTNEDVVVITNTNEADVTLQKYFLWESPPTIVDDEQYYVYFIPRGTLTSQTN